VPAASAPGSDRGRARLNWFLFSLGAAVTQAAQFAIVKGRAQAIPPIVIVAWTQTVATLAWLAFFAVSGHAFTWSRAAWPAVLGSSVLVMGMSTLIARASARGDISIVGPVYALSPIFTVIPDAVLSGTLPSPLGWLGLGLAVAGTSSLSKGAAGGGSLRALFRRRDALDALGAAVLLGFLAAVDRWGALALGPPSYLVCAHGATAVLTTAIALIRCPRGIVASTSPANLVTVVTHGLLGVTGTGMQTSALTMAPAAYVNAIRRLSAVVAVVLGRTLFAEADLGRRMTAAALACAGAACLLLAH
jgi:drug/metabolite transporter (DMT)-like permease